MSSIYSSYGGTSYTASSLLAASSSRSASEKDAKLVENGARTASADLTNAEAKADETTAEMSNAGGSSEYKVKQYKTYAVEAGKALVDLKTGDAAKASMDSHVLKLLNGEIKTGDEVVDSVIDILNNHPENNNSMYLRVNVDMSGIIGTDGNDMLTVESEGNVLGARMGDGMDMLTVSADIVSGIKTDSDPIVTAFYESDGEEYARSVERQYSNSDYLEVNARIASDLDTGGGDDTLRVAADYVSDVSGGDGDDKIRIEAGKASGVRGGTGSDTITVKAAVVGDVSGGDGNDVIAVVAQASSGYADSATNSTVESRMRDALGAQRISGGEGDDKVAVAVGSAVRVSGGVGDDNITLAAGTVALERAAGDGNDVVELRDGVELVLNAAPSSVTHINDDVIYMEFADGGTMIIEGVSEASSIAYTDENNQFAFLKQEERLDQRI